jgi:hypothetical protein
VYAVQQFSETEGFRGSVTTLPRIARAWCGRAAAPCSFDGAKWHLVSYPAASRAEVFSLHEDQSGRLRVNARPACG